jgi:hypothetical protein
MTAPASRSCSASGGDRDYPKQRLLCRLFRKLCGSSLIAHPGKGSAPRRLVHAAVVARRPGCGTPHPPAGGFRSAQAWIDTALDGRASRGPPCHTPAKTLGAHRLAPVRKREAIYSSPRAPHLQSRGSPARTALAGMEQPVSRITKSLYCLRLLKMIVQQGRRKAGTLRRTLTCVR